MQIKEQKKIANEVVAVMDNAKTTEMIFRYARSIGLDGNLILSTVQATLCLLVAKGHVILINREVSSDETSNDNTKS